jgi:FAD/FMN-containing dehydrogenase
VKPEKLGREIQKIIKGKVFWDKQYRDIYSVDASSYRIKPLVIVQPKNECDVIAIVKFASKNNISVTARGAGTGLVGSALGNGIILDMRYFDKIKVYSNKVVAGSGVYKGQLDKVLGENNRFFGPNPSVGPYCTIGGMIATNASGSHSLKYGSTIDNLLGIRCVTADGKIISLPSSSRFSKVFDLIKPHMNKQFPRVSKNSCGYRIDHVTKKSDLQKIIAGSEGTLGIILSAKIKTFPIRKKTMLSILSYMTIKQAARDVTKIIRLKPSALEIIDYNIAKNINIKLAKDAECLLFVEFDDNVKKCMNQLKNITCGKIIRILQKNDDIKKWWNFRNAALSYSLRSIDPKQSMPTIIEDAVVPVENLELLVDIIKETSKKYGLRFVLYGHAGNGNLHIRPILRRENKNIIKKIARGYFKKVVEIGGSITGEHGDGLARSEFVRLQYGNEVYSVFEKIKNRFDPQNILNPGKIISCKTTVTKNLKI